MARPKQFDRDVALRKAMDLFWVQGYQATSLDDLTGHLGIGRASLYGTFGSKHELFLSALDLYIQDRVILVGGALEKPGPVVPVITQVIEGFIRRAIDRDRPGCMVVSTASELSTSDSEAAERVRSTWKQLEMSLEAALTRAREQGELTSDRDPAGLASFLVVFIQGLLVVGKGDPDPDRLQAATRQALEMLR